MKNISGKRIFIDSAPIIYFIEKHPSYHKILKEIFLECNKGNIQLFSSYISIIEVLTLPYRKGELKLAKKYEKILLNSEISIININNEIAIKSAFIRGTYNVKTPDANQLAASICNETDYFLSNVRICKKYEK